MALKLADWSTTPGSNTSVDGVSIAEGAPFANMNNSQRAIMAAVKYEVASFGSSVSAAAAPDIGSVGGALTINGVSTIGGFATAPAGLLRVLHFETATPIVPGANLSAPFTSITTAKGDTAAVRSLGSAVWKFEWFTRKNVSPKPLRGHIAGLTLSNNSGDATNDIDIAIGEATADDESALLILTSALTKQLDAAWAVGTNQGMRATGAAISNTTYHIFLIRRPDTGVVDIAADTSATGANIAANTDAAYTQKRRIGSIMRESAAIAAFRQVGDTFRRFPSALDRNSTSAVASALLTVSVPLGISVAPIFQVYIDCAASVQCIVSLGSAAAGAAEQQVATVLTGASDSSAAAYSSPHPSYFTNTSAQIYFAQANSTGTPANSTLRTFGWLDRRGQDD